MIKTYLSLLVIFTALITIELKAQNRHSFTILCIEKIDNENGSDDYIGTFTGFTAAAIDSYKEFTTITHIRGMVGQPHTFYIQLVSPSGEVIERVKTFSFYLEDVDYQHKLSNEWSGIFFTEEGMHAIECYIDDQLDSVLYFRVGNN